ncbi:MAG: S41 family peptidase [Candidatus Omnitrophica bacterium]|nr:S41 family peptidase [Candidatus Omnitrophota bacterium]
MSRNRIRTIGLVAAVFAVLVLGVRQTATLGAKANPSAEASANEEIYKELELFEHALSIVRSHYVAEPKAKDLIYGALKGMLAVLDPYSQFLDPDSYNELKVDTEGEFGGLGIEITIKDDLLTVIAPIDDTPAFKAGLMAGDRIVKIDGELTRGITLLEAVKKLRGKPGTPVALTIFREGETELKEVTLERAIITIQSVREASILEDHIAYIRLSDFRERTADDLAAAVGKLKEQGMDSLILDLRNNPGGLLDVSVSVSELFLERNQLIVSTKGRLRNQNQELRSRMTGPVSDLPMVVLINEGSASASEIVAGAIQDHHRGIVMGTKSHGKASVQTIFPLKDGSALRLTTSAYFTPEGRSIHGQGIVPDVEVPFEKPPEQKPKGPTEDQVFERLESDPDAQDAAEKPSADLVERKRMDNQLARAIDLLKGIKVYQAEGRVRAQGRSRVY